MKPRPDWVQNALDKKELVFPRSWDNPLNFSMRPNEVSSRGAVPDAAYGFDKTIACENDILIYKRNKIKVYTCREFFLKGYEIVEE